MNSPADSFLKDAEAFLTHARKYGGELTERKALLRQLELMKRTLEHPMDNMVNHWVNVRKSASRDPYSSLMNWSSMLMDIVR